MVIAGTIRVPRTRWGGKQAAIAEPLALAKQYVGWDGSRQGKEVYTRKVTRSCLVKEFGLTNSLLTLAVLTGAASQLGLAQSADSARKDTVELVASLKGHDAPDALAFSPDGKILAATYQDGKLVLWSVAKGKPIRILQGQVSSGNYLVFSPDGKRLAVTSGWESLNIWDIDNGRKVIHLEDRSGGGLAWVAFSPDGKLMVTGGMNAFGHLRTTGIVTLRETKDGKVKKTVKLEDGPVHSGDFSPDGKTLALATSEHWAGLKMSVTLWGELVGDVFGTSNHGLQWTPHGKVKVMEVPTGKVLKSLTAHDDWTEVVRFSPDGRMLATGGADGVVNLWDVPTWKDHFKLKGHEDGITSLAFSPDGKLLASAGRYSIKLWDVASGRELPELSKHLKGGNSVAFTPQGCILATGAPDIKDAYFNPPKDFADFNLIRLWKVQTFQGPMPR
jgi:WD40 repeat protein